MRLFSIFALLLAPAIAQEMADVILGKTACVADFDPRRFSKEI